MAGTDDEQPLLAVKTVTAKDFSRGTPTDTKGNQTRLAGAAVKFLVEGGVAFRTGGLYRVVADPKLGEQLLAHVRGNRGLLRGFYRDGGKIVGHAKFKPVVGPQMAMVGLLLFEVATLITSTAHLKDIATQLKALNEAVGKIQMLLEDQRTGRLHGNVAYLAEVLALDQEGLLTVDVVATYLSQIEAIHRECLADIATCALQLARRQAELKKVGQVRVKGALFWKKVDDVSARAVMAATEDLAGALELSALALETAFLGCAVANKLGVSHGITERRLDALAVRAAQLATAWTAASDVVARKFEPVAGRADARASQATLVEQVSRDRHRPERLMADITRARQRLADVSQVPVEMLVRIEDGEVAELRTLNAPAPIRAAPRPSARAAKTPSTRARKA